MIDQIAADALRQALTFKGTNVTALQEELSVLRSSAAARALPELKAVISRNANAFSQAISRSKINPEHAIAAGYVFGKVFPEVRQISTALALTWLDQFGGTPNNPFGLSNSDIANHRKGGVLIIPNEQKSIAFAIDQAIMTCQLVQNLRAQNGSSYFNDFGPLVAEAGVSSPVAFLAKVILTAPHIVPGMPNGNLNSALSKGKLATSQLISYLGAAVNQA